MDRKKVVIFITLVLIANIHTFAAPAELLKSSGVKGGLVVHLGCHDGTKTVGLLLNDSYIVQGLDISDEKVQQARRNILNVGCYGKVSARKFDGTNLPYVKNLVNVIIVENKFQVSKKEILRVLAPLGVAFIDGQKIVKPWPENMDEWNHFLHGADNNAVAQTVWR